MLTLLDRYITRQLVDYFSLGIVVFTLLLFFSDTLLDLMKELQHYGIPMDMALALIGLKLPEIVATVIPMGILLATLMVYNTLSNQFELITMRMSGISLHRLALPAMVMAMTAALCSYLLLDYVVPTCNKLSRALKTYAINQQNLPATQENFTYKQFDKNQQLQRLIYISKFHNDRLGYSTIIDLTNPNTLQVTQARSGLWGENIIELHDASVHTVSNNQKLSNTTAATRLQLKNFIHPQKEVSLFRPREESFWELKRRIDSRIRRGIASKNREIYVTLWEKLTIPLSPIPLALIAIPLAITSPRKLSNLGFLMAILIFFCYYIVRHVAVHLGESGVLPPLLAAATPILLFSALGILLFQRKNKVL